MKTTRRLWPLLALALLLVQMPMIAPSFSDSSPADVQLSNPMGMDGDHCHDADTPPCDDCGCVFCGLATPGAPPQINAYLAHLLFFVNAADPLTPRFEQPVELRPPKNLLSA